MNIRSIHSKNEIAQLVEEHPDYQELLFARGYLLTNDTSIDPERYPFCGKWNTFTALSYHVYVHPNETFFSREANNRVVALVGHAYSPFTMQWEEDSLLRECDGLFAEDLWNKVAEWTGVFVFFVITERDIQIFGDAGMMKMCNYCVDDDHFYVSSHFQMLADLKNYSMCDYARKIRTTKLYNTGMRWLPGDMTAYDNIHRLGANLTLTYDGEKANIKRSYPTSPHREANTKEEQVAESERLFNLLHNGIALCLQKWPGDMRVGLSLTGGMDSGGEFACTKGLTEKIRVFSYDCKEQELIDSEAAKKICEAVGIPHFQYHIPQNSADLPCGEDNYRFFEAIVDHNTGYIMNLAENEIRKIVYFNGCRDFDVEMKADVAEIGRAFYDQKYGMKMPRCFSPRQIAILQTRFFFMPKLQRQTERKYKTYNEVIALNEPLYNYEHSDLLYWENRIAAATGMSVLSVGMSHLQTLPYNNRAILECMLAFPRDLRRENVPQQMLKERYMPKMISDEAEVKNKYLGNNRIFIERLFFKMKSLPILGRI